MGPVTSVKENLFKKFVTNVQQSILPNVKKLNEVIRKVAGTGRSVNGFIGKFIIIPKNVNKVFSSAKILSGISVLFALPVFVTKIRKIFNSKTNSKQELAVIKSSMIAAGVVGGMGSFMQGLATAGAISIKATAWVAKAMPYLFPFQVFGSLLNLHGTYKAYQFKKEMGKEITAEASENSIIGACAFILKQNAKQFSKYTSFNSSVIKEKAQSIITRIRSGNQEEKTLGIEEGKQLMELLKSRVRITFALHMLRIVLSVAALVGSIILMIAGTANLIGAGILASTATVGLGIYLYQFAALKSNPYKAIAPLHKRIIQRIQKTGQKIHGLVKKNITSPITTAVHQLFQRNSIVA